MSGEEAYEQKVKSFYNDFWSNPHLGTRRFRPEGGWHFGYYRTHRESVHDAVKAMNTYIGETLNLHPCDCSHVLDAGCGVGATTIELAQAFPNSTFVGITLAPQEVIMARELQRKRGVKNTSFVEGSYLRTDFPDHCFDAIYALESFIYASDKKAFIDEMKRLLKPNGRLVIAEMLPRYIFGDATAWTHRMYFWQRDVVSFQKVLALLRGEGFTIRKTTNLMKGSHVPLFQLIQYMAWVLFTPKNKGVNSMNPRKYHQGRLGRMLHLPGLLLGIVIGFSSFYGYYVIIAENEDGSF